MGLYFALRFLTALPVPHVDIRPGEIGRSAAFFPVVGLLLGLALAGLDLLLRAVWPLYVANAGLIVAAILLTGGLHLDGLMDSCDGLFGRRDPQRRLEIMRDSRVGSFGVLGAVSALLLLFACLSEMPLPWRPFALVLAGTLSRWTMVLAIWAFPYARAEGLGRAFKDDVGVVYVLCATLVAMAVVAGAVWLGLAPAIAAAVLSAAAATGLLSAAFVMSRIPGLTGDSYGAINQLAELSVWLAFLALLGAGYG
ncbi:MAG: adenosylcobinamide-GDP ribazoletransferase [Chloroflexota bacterium]